MKDIQTRYEGETCDECGSDMRYVYEPITNDFTGYVCMRPECDNHYTEVVY